jgi:serine/alanine adding enzyme
VAAALVEVEPESWDAVLRGLGVTDAYLGRGFVRASAALVDAEPVLLHLAAAGGDVVFAALLRDDPRDVVSPYGYGGPVAVGDAPPLDVFRDAYAGWCADRGVLSSFVVFHPLFGNDAYAAALGFRRVPLEGTVAWRLAEPDLRARMHRHHRRMVRRAEAAGLAATVERAPADLSAFVALYTDAMRYLDAAAFYRFPPPYWEALRREVPVALVEVRDADGGLAAAVLGMGGPPWLHYHLGASAEHARGSGASHLALCSLAEWGQAHGYDVLHLGGGVGGRADSLLEYKLRFAPDGLLPAATGRAVHDRAAYAALTGSDAIDWEGFFPAYRARR